jgi:hypothetical protein
MENLLSTSKCSISYSVFNSNQLYREALKGTSVEEMVKWLTNLSKRHNKQFQEFSKQSSWSCVWIIHIDIINMNINLLKSFTDKTLVSRDWNKKSDSLGIRTHVGTLKYQNVNTKGRDAYPTELTGLNTYGWLHKHVIAKGKPRFVSDSHRKMLPDQQKTKNDVLIWKGIIISNLSTSTFYNGDQHRHALLFSYHVVFRHSSWGQHGVTTQSQRDRV